MEVKGWDINTINNQDFDDLSRIMNTNSDGKKKAPVAYRNGQRVMSMADFMTKGVNA
jgi:hypothetical protein